MTTPQGNEPELAIVQKTNVLPMLSPAIAAQGAAVASEIIRLMLTNGILQSGRHFGVIPNTKSKPTLFKPGSELLCKAFGYSPMFNTLTVIEDWDKKLFFYRIECKMVDTATGIVIATGEGSCNSYESKYRYRWLWPNELAEHGLTKETPGLITRTVGKNKTTQYRIENDDIYSLVNTINKMACKRALIAAALIGTGASEFFTQDIEDIPQFGGLDEDAEVIDAESTVVSNGHTEVDPMDYVRLGIRTGTGIDDMQESEMCRLLSVPTLTKEAIKAKYEGKTGKELVQIALDAFEKEQPRPGDSKSNDKPIDSPDGADSKPKSKKVDLSTPPDDAPEAIS